MWPGHDPTNCEHATKTTNTSPQVFPGEIIVSYSTTAFLFSPYPFVVTHTLPQQRAQSIPPPINTAAMGDASATSADTNPSFLLESLKKVTLTTLPKPSIQNPHDVIVRIAQTGICMSDIHYWQRGRIGDFILTTPIVLGHESSGTVTSIGVAVKNLRIGDRVAIEPGVPCRHCNYCRSGSYNLCADTVFAATPPHHGTLSKYYRTSADFCYVLPGHVDDEAGALCEPVAVGVQVCKVGKVGMNQTVVVFGCGTIGLLCQAVAKAAGAKVVIGVDVSERRMRLAEELGWADGTFMSPGLEGGSEGMSREDAEVEWSGKVAGMIKKKFGLGDGPDVVLECTGAQACIQTGVQLVKKGGMYVQAGMGREVS
jgi:D-xylulose reductase